MVELLIKAGAEVSPKALELATAGNRPELISLLKISMHAEAKNDTQFTDQTGPAISFKRP